MADFTQEQIEDILTSDEKDGVIAKRLGVHWKTIQKVRKEAANGLQEEGQGPEEVKRAHNDDGTFKADDPATPDVNEAYEQPKSEGVYVGGPATGYRDGKDGTVERCNFDDGFVPKGWHTRPWKCKNCPKDKHADYVDVKV